MPVFFRHRPDDAGQHVVALRIFSLPEGLACVVTWPLPEPGLRVFSPTGDKPESLADALPYAQFLGEHLGALRVTVEMDEGVEWQPAWGELRYWSH